MAGGRCGPDGAKNLAVHWRHGDYVAYQLLTPLASIANRIVKELERSGCRTPLLSPDAAVGSSSCAVFLLTNCKNESAVAELRGALAPVPLVSYTLHANDSNLFANEGRRLVIEQAIASLADSFVASPRSGVRETPAAGAKPNPARRSGVHLSAQELQREEVRRTGGQVLPQRPAPANRRLVQSRSFELGGIRSRCHVTPVLPPWSL